MRTIDQFVQGEVLLCASELVDTIARAHGHKLPREIGSLAEQAADLCSPEPDFEAAATWCGWTQTDDGEYRNDNTGETWTGFDWEDLCYAHDIDPDYREVYEHWVVTKWLAEKLAAHDEKVDTDFAGLCIWARTTTGQAITMDEVIQQIYKEAGGRP